MISSSSNIASTRTTNFDTKKVILPTVLNHTFWKHLINLDEFIRINNQEGPCGEIIAVKFFQDAWHGKAGAHRHHKESKLSQSWVDATFRDFFLENCICKPNEWIRVYAGHPKDPEVTAFATSPVIHTSSKALRYPQGNLKTCMIGSFASCLHYMDVHENKIGLSDKANAIMRNLGDIFKSENVFNKFFHIVTQQCKDRYKLVQNKTFSFDQEEELFNMPTLVVLFGHNNAMDHAITVYKNMIFDTSHDTIREQCRQTLDWCCAPNGLKKINCAYSLIEKTH